MLPLITSQMQDATLQWLCSNVRLGDMVPFDWHELLNTTGIDDETMEVILEDFEERGLIKNFNLARIGPALILKVEAHKFHQKGGFTVMDALNEANMQKLLYELDNLKKQLKPDQLDTLNKVTTIMASIASVIVAFNPKS